MDNYNNNFNAENDQNFVIVNSNKEDKFSNTWETADYKIVEPKKKRKGRGKVAALITGGLLCAIIGGVIGAGGVYYLNRKLYTTDVNGTTATKGVNYDPPTFAKDEQALTTTDVVKKVSPAVVTVSTNSIQQGLFSPTEQEGVGSGFIINEEGYVLTNFHVISGAQQLKVTLNSGKEVNAKIVNYDQEQDLAVVRITDNIKVPGVVELGDSDALQAGEEVIAIGSPLGKEFVGSVTKGIISSPSRVIESNGKKTTFIQTDATINPGNSGGPLINSTGQVIGINTAKKVGEGIEGMGFSIPINQVKDRLATLSKPILKLGVQVREVDANTAKQNNLEEGIWIADVEEFSPAEKGGIQRGDLIINFDGQRVKKLDELNKLKEKHKSGDTVKITVLRDGKEVNLNIKLTE
ncbi:type I deoxyribonuclease HsdR [Clostridium polyendosporum]|uniref:Type I deoxyribonuclease HsdR n=1 Tax=Clostridium polyendosporum TaxID=69208 RepID=A0A919S0D0_9CLOT|nr:trypsin-like peptidase domain-containing protein [Clostridium polyendosporum]GIM29631.1 type I deoxyribonuclease HsdR [Clostridium polyendosporum]